MKKAVLIGFMATAALGAQAQSLTDDHRLLGKIGIYSDYRQHGRTQTDFKPALQGAISYHHIPSGLYAGVWGSSVHWVQTAFPDSGGTMETNLTIGRIGGTGSGSNYDIGVRRISYPGSSKPDGGALAGTEVFMKLGYGALHLKYTHNMTDRPGVSGSKNSGVAEVGMDAEIARGRVLSATVGYDNLMISKGKASSHTLFWKAGLAQFVDGPNFWMGLDLTQSHVSKDEVGGVTAGGDSTGKMGVVVYMHKTF